MTLTHFVLCIFRGLLGDERSPDPNIGEGSGQSHKKRRVNSSVKTPKYVSDTDMANESDVEMSESELPVTIADATVSDEEGSDSDEEGSDYDDEDSDYEEASEKPRCLEEGMNTQALALTVTTGRTQVVKDMKGFIPELSNTVVAMANPDFKHCSGKKLRVFALPDGSGLQVDLTYPHPDGIWKLTIEISTNNDTVKYTGTVPPVIEQTLFNAQKCMNMYHTYLKLVDRANSLNLTVTKLLVDGWSSIKDLRGLSGFKPLKTLLFNNTKPRSECPKKEITTLRWLPVILVQALCTLSQMQKYAPSGLTKNTPTIWNLLGLTNSLLLPSDTTFGTKWDQLVLSNFKSPPDGGLQKMVNSIFRSTISRATLKFCDFSPKRSVYNEAQLDQMQAGAQHLLYAIDTVAGKLLQQLSEAESIHATIADNEATVEDTRSAIEYLEKNKLQIEADELRKNVGSLQNTNTMLKTRNAALADEIKALEADFKKKEEDFKKKEHELQEKSNLSSEEKAKLVESGRKIEKVHQALRRSCRTTAGIPATRLE